ncbi:MAG: hydroxymethylglutaryl-CoA lyase [Myxococcales bacterium]|nr:hydroxymethylglutaryl-CoA lyase [Myxococcales bacterium]
MPKSVRVYEVGPRDGLQNEEAFVPSEDKIELIKSLSDAGLPYVEITSFVHPRWIPALADADRVAAAFEPSAATTYTALVPNERGLDRALKTPLREVAVFMSASETHNARNINKSRQETFTAFKPVFQRCHDAGVAVRAYVSTVWGCPYEGAVSPAEAVEVAEKLLELGAYEISLGDTIGVGNPAQTCAVLETFRTRLGLSQIAMHMHDTRGLALANCLVGLEYGVTTFDTSIAGLGGCPYAPGASGNLATEDLVGMLHGMGIETGIDFDKLVTAGRMATQLLGRTLPGRTLQACMAEHTDD